jgi:hypothetical protein
MSAAQASYLALPNTDRARIEEFVGDPSTAVKRTYTRRCTEQQPERPSQPSHRTVDR